MPIDSQSEYESRMYREAASREREIDTASLSDRKEAQKEFLSAMATEPAIVAERIGWLIDGNYGYGEMKMAKQVIASPRMNRETALTQLVAVFEWMCPRRMAIDAWKKLTVPQKKALSEAIAVVIFAAEADVNKIEE
jgi:hypothetical protein